MSVRTRTQVWGIGLIVLAIAAISVPAIGQKGMQTAVPQDRLFSHEKHASTVKVECARCHAATADGEWQQKGKKEHARCFSCHKFSSSCGTLKQKEGKVCLTCHVTFKSECTPSGYVAPAAGLSEFSANYSHRKHIRPSQSGEQCESCHGSFGAGAPTQGNLSAGHALCSGCHARGVTPRIKESCDGCHSKGTGQAVVAKRNANPFAVKGKFDHQAHAAVDRVGTAGRACLTCHENIKSAEADTTVPLPTMQSCQKSCHDGKKAFNAIGTTCTKCHTQGGN